MGLLNRSGRAVKGELDDETWIHNGYKRFESGKSRCFGSPETMKAGGDAASLKGDSASAVFYYAKAIDIAQTWVIHHSNERSDDQDFELFDAYVTSIETIRRTRPGADVVTDWNNDNGRYTLRMMVSIARYYLDQGRSPHHLDLCINRLISATGMTVN